MTWENRARQTISRRLRGSGPLSVEAKDERFQHQQFIDIASGSYPGITPIREDLDAILGYLADQDAIIVLDEFPYLVEQDESLPRYIQMKRFYGF